jgi:hypothetical protein
MASTCPDHDNVTYNFLMYHYLVAGMGSLIGIMSSSKCV